MNLVVMSFFGLFGSEVWSDDFDDMRRSENFVIGEKEGHFNGGRIILLAGHKDPFV